MQSGRGKWAELKGVGSYGTIGLEMVLSVLFGLFGGRWLDGRLGTEPVLMLLGFGFGVAAAVRALWRSLKEMQRQTASDGWHESETDRPARYALEQREAVATAPGDELADRLDGDDPPSARPDAPSPSPPLRGGPPAAEDPHER